MPYNQTSWRVYSCLGKLSIVLKPKLLSTTTLQSMAQWTKESTVIEGISGSGVQELLSTCTKFSWPGAEKETKTWTGKKFLVLCWPWFKLWPAWIAWVISRRMIPVKTPKMASVQYPLLHLVVWSLDQFPSSNNSVSVSDVGAFRNAE